MAALTSPRVLAAGTRIDDDVDDPAPSDGCLAGVFDVHGVEGVVAVFSFFRFFLPSSSEEEEELDDDEEESDEASRW